MTFYESDIKGKFQMAKIGLWIFSGGLLILGIVGGICCCLQVIFRTTINFYRSRFIAIILLFAGQKDVRSQIYRLCQMSNMFNILYLLQQRNIYLITINCSELLLNLMKQGKLLTEDGDLDFGTLCQKLSWQRTKPKERAGQKVEMCGNVSLVDSTCIFHCLATWSHSKFCP